MTVEAALRGSSLRASAYSPTVSSSYHRRTTLGVSARLSLTVTEGKNTLVSSSRNVHDGARSVGST